MYKVVFYKQAAKYYSRINAKNQQRIDMAISKLIENPFESYHIKKLKGRLEGKYRYDIGNSRLIYIVSEKDKIIYIDAIGPRGDIYK